MVFSISVTLEFFIEAIVSTVWLRFQSLTCIQSGAEGFIGLLHYKACCLTKAKVSGKGGSSLSKCKGRKETELNSDSSPVFRATAHEHAKTDVRMHATISIQLIGQIRNGFVTQRFQRECAAY